ncbi:hypothetical protein WJX84_011987 [Apatococcus fuscideae]|uniref:Hydroxymethylglutaryl-coenzyme A synthase N-terminal domain-containing protein n=1 Tax=Apatococcus fuscideae TaxID=2026836 RepID=A0AAW1S0G9_9CHLO
MDKRPADVGILALEVYFPTHYVSQGSLEQHDGASPGKYTEGHGQKEMSFCSDREDATSMGLTAFKHLLESYSISPKQIGRLEVGSESGEDRGKSIKTTLMTLFEGSGNTDVEGVDCLNACYGSTAALRNAVAWVESSGWDGRLAVVVASDIAVYPPGPARPTGGAGAVAMLIVQGLTPL